MMAIERNILLFLLISIGLITLPHFSNLPLPLFGFFFLLWSWRLLSLWKPTWLPNGKVIFITTVIGITLLISQHQGVFGRDAGTALFVTALGLKLLEIRNQRDVYLVTFLAFIVATTLFLYQQSILMAVYTLFVCIVLLATLIAINSLQQNSLAALKTASLILLQALPLAIVIFVVFPRMEAPRWMLFNDPHHARTGLSDSLEPGSISNLGLSDELAFRVRFDGAIPPPNQRYWRGPVFSQTDGKRWTESKNRHFKRFQDKLRFSGTAYRYTLLLEPQNNKWVYALDMAADFSDTLQQNSFYQLISRKDPHQRAEFRVTSYPEYNTGYLTQTELNDNLQLPGDPSPRTRKLVEQLQGFEAKPKIFIQNILNHFRNEKFYYTLMPKLMEENPIETFLFESRYGFCSHYATAFVYLLRVANVPARVVGGYQGGELNKLGNFLEIRQANAHAWAEVWLQNEGWVRVDPTAAIAPERIEQDVNIDLQIANGAVNFTPVNIGSGSMQWLKQTRYFWNSIDYQWQRWVVNYNSVGQAAFLASLGINNVKTIVFWLIGIITVISAILAWLLLRKPKAKTDPVLRLYQTFRRCLIRKGTLDLKTGEGPVDFARRASQHYPLQAEQINLITALFIRLRYHQDPNSADFNQLKHHIHQFKLSVRRS
jgi:protein-glutamine gamma-glutamyltransferase